MAFFFSLKFIKGQKSNPNNRKDKGPKQQIKLYINDFGPPAQKGKSVEEASRLYPPRDATELRRQRRLTEEKTRSSQAIFKSIKSLTGSTLLKTIFIDPSYNLRSSCIKSVIFIDEK
ncbi:hypothetical protein YC2023_010276 [Brassica napus]